MDMKRSREEETVAFIHHILCVLSIQCACRPADGDQRVNACVLMEAVTLCTRAVNVNEIHQHQKWNRFKMELNNNDIVGKYT